MGVPPPPGSREGLRVQDRLRVQDPGKILLLCHVLAWQSLQCHLYSAGWCGDHQCRLPSQLVVGDLRFAGFIICRWFSVGMPVSPYLKICIICGIQKSPHPILGELLR